MPAAIGSLAASCVRAFGPGNFFDVLRSAELAVTAPLLAPFRINDSRCLCDAARLWPCHKSRRLEQDSNIMMSAMQGKCVTLSRTIRSPRSCRDGIHGRSGRRRMSGRRFCRVHKSELKRVQRQRIFGSDRGGYATNHARRCRYFTGPLDFRRRSLRNWKVLTTFGMPHNNDTCVPWWVP